MRPAFRVEGQKLLRSRVTFVATILIGLLLPAMGLGFYTVATTGGAGLLADKASALLFGEGWLGYVGMIDQIAAVAVFLGAGIVVAWMFGREHVDRTFPSLFALPVPRTAMAAAKFTVVTIWMVALAVLVAGAALILGLIAGIEPMDTGTVFGELTGLMWICLGAGMLSLTMGFVASVGRGYLAAIGAMAVIIAIAQVAVLFGAGGWFPFAVPGLMAIAGAEGAPSLGLVQLLLVPALAVASVWATIRWWRTAEVV